MKKLKAKDVIVPLDVPRRMQKEYVKNYLRFTHRTGHVMLMAGDQKIEHLNKDFFGNTEYGPIATDDNDPEHLFRVASQATISCFASQLGLISRYGPSYPKIPFLVKLNSKTNLVKTAQQEPISTAMWSVDQVVRMKKDRKLNILAVGYTLYLGSEFEAVMLHEAAQMIYQAHQNGLLSVLWIYPRGKAVKNEKDPHIIAGAAGVAACLGSDFVKLNFPKTRIGKPEIAFKEAVTAAGRTGIVVSGGSSTNPKQFLKNTYTEVKISGAKGNATGRNLHQKPEKEAIRFANALASITLGGKDAEFAYEVYQGKKRLKL
ncbi:aldolase [Candidatus Woesearchaeota archaeon]|nr:aldolase [Candidatus Woesearchaeota archaeon]